MMPEKDPAAPEYDVPDEPIAGLTLLNLSARKRKRLVADDARQLTKSDGGVADHGVDRRSGIISRFRRRAGQSRRAAVMIALLMLLTTAALASLAERLINPNGRGWLGKLTEKIGFSRPANGSAKSLPIDPNAPTQVSGMQLSKEYIYAGARLLAVEDYNSTGGSGNPTPTPPVEGCPAGYTSLGGVITTEPSAVVFAGRVYVFARGTDGAVYYLYSNGGAFSGWLGGWGTIISRPATQTNGVTLLVEGTGTDNNRYYKTSNDGDNFSSWIGGTVTTQTSSSASLNGSTYNFVKGGGSQPPLCVQATPTSGGTTNPTSNSASYVTTDTTTQGNWMGVYGSQGYMLANYGNNLPAWSQISISGASWTWANSTSQTNALQKPDNPNDRIAATWYTPGAFELPSEYQISLNFTDGQTHRLALYCLDWDAVSRNQQIEILDAQSGTVLDTRNVTNFAGGAYLVWQIKGQVVIKIKNASQTSRNGVVSGLFIDGGGATSSAANTASFLTTDTTTQGNWIGSYGSQGYILANSSNSVPAWAQVSLTGNAAWTWAETTPDVRALKKAADPNDRIAATWYTLTEYGVSEYQITANFTDGQTHRVALYCLDWDANTRNQQIEIVDAQSGALLDTRNVSNFAGGVYLVWQVKGRVIFKVRTTTGSANAVVSGLFIND